MGTRRRLREVKEFMVKEGITYYYKDRGANSVIIYKRDNRKRLVPIRIIDLIGVLKCSVV